MEGTEPEVWSLDSDATVEVRDATRRELDIRLLPWNTPIDTMQGREMFVRGAFAGTDPGRVLLMGMEHEAHLGLAQDGRATLVRRPAGKGINLVDRDDGPVLTVRVSKTQSGDEILALASDGIVTGASIEFAEVPGGTESSTVNGRRTRTHRSVALRAVSTTYRPAYGEQAGVIAIRSQEPTQERNDPVSETLEAPVIGVEIPTVDLSPVLARMEAMQTTFTDRFAALEEHNRSMFSIPGIAPEPSPRAMRGDWMGTVLRMLSGERVSDQQMRVLADLVTTDNVGVVPDAYSTELIGVIDPSRPFLQSTRKLDLPAAGMSLLVPTIVTRPTAGVQAAEKDDIASRATSITNSTFDAITIAGGGDISIQLLKRSSPSYLSLFLELLAEAYAQNCEAEAVDILINAIGGGGVNDGGTLDPANLLLADAWDAGATVRKRIDTIWMSSQAVGAFIDAKATDSNLPLYSTIQAGFTAGSGPAGTISGLRPVWVPALDHTVADVIVGPSSGFGWTEDGTYTLQVDVPAKAGRDVALVGIVWLALMYPTAFTAYDLAGGS